MELREEFVVRARTGSMSFSSLCREYGISRKTGYKWVARHSETGIQGLKDRPKEPKSAAGATPEPVVCKIVRLKQAHPCWGPKKIHALYQRTACETVSLSSVKRILKRCGLVKENKRRRHPPAERLNVPVEAQTPNDIWTVDFKGWWYAKDRRKCEPLTVRDEYSRYLLEVRLLENTRTEAVREAFERLFKLYGLPRVIKSDNGPPFASAKGARGLSRLAAWWISLGIKPHRIDPGKPQQNGSHERMHKDIKAEIQKEVKGNSQEVQNALELWREEYNSVRPHEALEMKTPADFYSKSGRKYPAEPLEAEYPAMWPVRKVHNNGCISVNRHVIFISMALYGYTVALKTLDETHYAVYFDYVELGLIDRTTWAFEPLSNKDLRL